MAEKIEAPELEIPIGLATWLGIAGAAVQYITALVILIVGGSDEAAIASLATATTTLVTVLGGRYAQAYAIRRDAPSLPQLNDASGEPDREDEELEPPSEEELAASFAEDPPMPEGDTKKFGDAP